MNFDIDKYPFIIKGAPFEQIELANDRIRDAETLLSNLVTLNIPPRDFDGYSLLWSRVGSERRLMWTDGKILKLLIETDCFSRLQAARVLPDFFEHTNDYIGSLYELDL